MALEIERKFLVNKTRLNLLENGTRIVQGYISTVGNTVVRVRITNEIAFLTLKGETSGMSRLEFEYEIPIVDAQQIIANLCTESRIEKTRYEMYFKGLLWEIDVFHGENEGLIIAEVELESENQPVDLPHWIVEEVTGQIKYYNSQLLKNPFKKWIKNNI